MARRKIKVANTLFASVTEAAIHFGVHKGNAVRRLNAGWTPEQALELEPKPKRQAHNKRTLITSIGVFESYRQAAITTGIQESTIQARVRKGWSHDQALELVDPPNREYSGNALCCDGKTFKSTAAFARHYSKNSIRTAKRLKRGWSPEQAVDLVKPPPRFRDHHGHARNHMWKKPTTIDKKLVVSAPLGSFLLYIVRNKKNGKEYIGITTNDLNARLRGHRRQAKLGTKSKLYNAIRHWGSEHFEIELIRNDAKDFHELQNQEIEEIVARQTLTKGYNTAKGGAIGTSKPIIIEDKEFPSMQAAASFYQIDATKFNLRVSRLGWSPEEAAELKKRRFNRYRFEVDGIEYKSLRSAANRYGIEYKLAHDRVKAKGWSIREALEIDPAPRISKKQVICNDVIYKSISELARAYGLSPDTVSNRLRKGNSPEQAVRPVACKNK